MFLPPLSPVLGAVPRAAMGDLVCTSLCRRAAVHEGVSEETVHEQGVRARP